MTAHDQTQILWSHSL